MLGAIGAIGTLGLSGCTGVVAQAPFRLRPDTTHFGSLNGPFEGHVFDQATTNPIAGAMVVGTWAFESEAGPAIPVAAYSVNTLTSSDGSYSLQALPVSQKRSALLRRFTLVIYKAGYIGYRSDLRWDDRTPRADFAQLANVAKLERIPAGESRAHHLVFLGGGQPLMRAAQAEVIQAALDLAERSPALPGDVAKTDEAPSSAKAASKPSVSTGPVSLAEQLLTLGDIEAAVQGGKRDYAAEALPSNLPGEAPSGEYSGVHYRAKGEKESFDAAMRVWRLASGTDAEAVWKRVRAQLQPTEVRNAGAGATITFPTERAAHPLVPEVPDKATPLRDGTGAPYALLPHAPAEAAPSSSASSGGNANGTAKTPPLPKIDGSLIANDAKQRAYGVALFVRRLGLVLELVCGADLCPSEQAAQGLLSRALTRL